MSLYSHDSHEKFVLTLGIEILAFHFQLKPPVLQTLYICPSSFLQGLEAPLLPNFPSLNLHHVGSGNHHALPVPHGCHPPGLPRRAGVPPGLYAVIRRIAADGRHFFFHWGVEAVITAFYGAETALVIGSGFEANTAIYAAIPRLGDAIVYSIDGDVCLLLNMLDVASEACRKGKAAFIINEAHTTEI